MDIKVEHNVDKVVEQLRNLRNDLEKKAAVNALNRAMQQARTAARRQIATTYAYKNRDVAATFTLYAARQGRIESTLRSRGKRVPLINMSARQISTGTKVKIKKQAKLIRSAFIATMKSGHIGVFSRKEGTQTGKRGGVIQNRKIKELYTIAIPEAFASAAIMEATKKIVGEVFFKRFRHELEQIIRRSNR